MATGQGVATPVTAWRQPARAIAAICLVVSLALLPASLATAATSSEISAAQQTLNALGYDVGTPDGSIGPRTRKAVRAFQKQYGLKNTGRLDSVTLTELTARTVVVVPPAEPVAEPPPPAAEDTDAGGTFLTLIIIGFIGWLFYRAVSSKSNEPVTRPSPAPRRKSPTRAVKITENNQPARQPAKPSMVNITVKTVNFDSKLPDMTDEPPVPLVAAPVTSTGRVFISYNKADAAPSPASTTPVHMTASGGRVIVTDTPVTDGPSLADMRQSPTGAVTISYNSAGDDPYNRASGSEACWVPAGRSVTVAGRVIPGGMVYVGRKLMRADGYAPENCLIDPSKPVADQGANDAGVDVPYWPSYSLLQPSARLSFLNWLAGGKKDPSIYIGYVFLYLYGLERRLMLDNPGTEALTLVTEVERLLWLYEDNHSFRRYATSLLNAAAVKLNLPVDWPELTLRKTTWQLPLDLLVCLGRAVSNGQPLTAQQMLNWYNCHSDKRLPALAGRCPDEFLALFTARFEAKFPGGFKLDAPKRQLGASYKAASSTFYVEFKVDGALPDVSGLTAPLNALDPIVDACAAELTTYARLIGKDRSKRNLVAAAATLPDHLLATTSAQPLADLKSWIEKRVKGDMGAVGIQELLERIGGEKAPSGNIPKADMVLIANALARCDFGIEPDARMDYPCPAVETDVIIFRAEDGAPLDTLTPAFLGALIHIDIGVLVASADGSVVLPELQAIGTAIAKNPNLTALEKRRLAARIAFMSKQPPSSRALSKFKDRPVHDREALSRLALSVAAADGVMAVEELRLLEKVYKTLSLPPARLYSDIQALNTGDEVLPTVAEPDKVTSIPIPPKPTAGTKRSATLDARRLARTRADTAVVSSILGEIFKDEQAVPATGGMIVAKLPGGVSMPEAETRFIGLDPRYLPLLIRVAELGKISRGDFEVLADSHNLLCDGAIEAINDWAFDRFDDAMLDDGSDIVVNKSILSLAQGSTA